MVSVSTRSRSRLGLDPSKRKWSRFWLGLACPRTRSRLGLELGGLDYSPINYICI